MMSGLNTIDLFIDKHRHNWFDYRPIQYNPNSGFICISCIYLSDKLQLAFVFVLHMFVFL